MIQNWTRILESRIQVKAQKRKVKKRFFDNYCSGTEIFRSVGSPASLLARAGRDAGDPKNLCPRALQGFLTERGHEKTPKTKKNFRAARQDHFTPAIGILPDQFGNIVGILLLSSLNRLNMTCQERKEIPHIFVSTNMWRKIMFWKRLTNSWQSHSEAWWKMHVCFIVTT